MLQFTSFQISVVNNGLTVMTSLASLVTTTNRDANQVLSSCGLPQYNSGDYKYLISCHIICILLQIYLYYFIVHN